MGEKLTESDVKKIEAEIENRKLVVRQECLAALKEARAQGDLSENFEYYAAKRDKNKNESRIRYLENMLRHATVISDASREDEVGINKEVTLYMEDEEEEETYRIVTSIRGNSLKNLVSTESALGRALMGRKLGERVYIRVSDTYGYYAEIKSIRAVDDSGDQIRSF